MKRLLPADTGEYETEGQGWHGGNAGSR